MKRISDEEIGAIIKSHISLLDSIENAPQLLYLIADAQLAADKEEKQEILDMIEEVAGYTGFFQYLTSAQKKQWGIE